MPPSENLSPRNVLPPFLPKKGLGMDIIFCCSKNITYKRCPIWKILFPEPGKCFNGFYAINKRVPFFWDSNFPRQPLTIKDLSHRKIPQTAKGVQIGQYFCLSVFSFKPVACDTTQKKSKDQRGVNFRIFRGRILPPRMGFKKGFVFSFFSLKKVFRYF